MKFRAFEPISLKTNVDALSIIQIPLSQIFPDPNQPRKNFQKHALEELASSIKQHGIIQPVILRQVAVERYQIIAGERRWRASKIAELEEIPAIIRTNNPKEDIAISLIENIQREELNPIELAKAFHSLHQDYHLSHEAIAEMVGKGRATVTNILRLLNLAEEVQILLVENKLEVGHAKTLLTFSSEEQIRYAHLIIEKNMTVRDIERLVQKCKQPQNAKIAPYSTEVKLWIKKLSNSLCSKVAIDINEKGQGRVVIHFSSLSEADWLVNHFTDNIKLPELD
jgi:ParB family transcriptional regulator, chromosome partitioning protein